jgi:hypothetical protein
VRSFSAEDDPNKLLGRPGQYTSKANFHDNRLEAPVSRGKCDPVPAGAPSSAEPVCHDTPKDPGVDDGGSVEFFASAGDAKRRHEYVSKLTEATPPFAEYSYLGGAVLLRLSHELTPSQAKAYQQVSTHSEPGRPPGRLWCRAPAKVSPGLLVLRVRGRSVLTSTGKCVAFKPWAL